MFRLHRFLVAPLARTDLLTRVRIPRKVTGASLFRSAQMERIIVAGFVSALSAPLFAQDGARLVSGSWTGDWQSTTNPSNYGHMDLEIVLNGHEVSGRVNAGRVGRCTVEGWQKLSGVVKGDKLFTSYQLGRPCGKVDMVLLPSADGTTMTGTWVSESPAQGTYSFRRVR